MTWESLFSEYESLTKISKKTSVLAFDLLKIMHNILVTKTSPEAHSTLQITSVYD